MKKVTITVLFLIVIIGNIRALDRESYEFINYLLNIGDAREPEIFEDAVIFTSSTVNRRVGIAFAHEGFSKVYWFQKLMVPKDQGPPPPDSKKERPAVYEETGLLFYVYTPPAHVQELAYRLVIDGLWSTDPLNPRTEPSSSAIAYSVTATPPRSPIPALTSTPPGIVNFNYQTEPGEKITVAGNFNSWDPFMYELRETSPGSYSLSLPLPPGTYHYTFYHRGERILDPANRNKVYTREGKTASEVIIR